MEFSIELTGERISLPIATGETIQGFIYKAISADKTFSEELHNVGKTYLGRKYKLFNFSEPIGKYEIEDGNIIYLSRVRLRIRSVDPYFIQSLVKYFSCNETVRLGNNTVRVSDTQIVDERVFEQRLTVRTLSPITVYHTLQNGHTTYFSPDDPKFYEMIVANAQRKWTSYFGHSEGFDLTVYSSEENGKYVKRATRFKTTYITAWHGTFILEGPPKVLDFLYSTGIGSKNSQGFGMIEIVEEK